MEEAFQEQATLRQKQRETTRQPEAFANARSQGCRQGGSHVLGEGPGQPPQELGNQGWQSKINLFFITSCQTEPVSSVFLVTVNIGKP